jgi:hypothetical protein
VNENHTILLLLVARAQEIVKTAQAMTIESGYMTVVIILSAFNLV